MEAQHGCTYMQMIDVDPVAALVILLGEIQQSSSLFHVPQHRRFEKLFAKL